MVVWWAGIEVGEKALHRLFDEQRSQQQQRALDSSNGSPLAAAERLPGDSEGGWGQSPPIIHSTLSPTFPPAQPLSLSITHTHAQHCSTCKPSCKLRPCDPTSPPPPPPPQVIMEGGRNVVPDVWEVLDKIKTFSDKVRSGEWKGCTGKPIKNVVAIGIGGSFLGPLFVHTALR